MSVQVESLCYGIVSGQEVLVRSAAFEEGMEQTGLTADEK
jgi:hypothetical protein